MADKFTSGTELENPLQFFDITLASGEVSDPLFFNFDYFRLLDLSGDSIAVRFGGSGTEAIFLGGGIGYKCPSIVPRVQFRNVSANPLTARVAVAIGEITDDRLSLSGNVSVVNAVGTYLEVNQRVPTSFATAQQAMVAATAASIMAANANRAYASIQAGNLDLFIGNAIGVTAATGFKVPAGSTYIVPHSAQIFGITAGVDTIFTDEGTF